MPANLDNWLEKNESESITETEGKNIEWHLFLNIHLIIL